MSDISKRLWAKAGMMQLPLAGSFELLPVCNLQCRMCYVRKSMAQVNAMGGLLSAEQWLDWADQARQEGMLFPLLTGGEPLLHRDFPRILSGMQEMGLQVSINSNGTLIDESMAKFLGQHRPTRVNITLYGASEETYEQLCGDADAYRRVRRGVELLKQYEVPVKFNASITPENRKDLTQMIGYAKSLHSPIQVATYMFPPVRRDPGLVGQNHRLSPEEAAEARVEADWLQNEPKWFLYQAERYSRFVEPTEPMLTAQAAMAPGEMTCRAGRCSFWIDWQGNIGNCGMYASVKLPLQGRSVSEAWKQVVSETDRVRYSPVCTNCPNFHLCHACIAMVYNECGDSSGRPEYLCRMNAASARLYREYAKRLPENLGARLPVEAETDSACPL